MSIVFARTIVNGKDHGIKPFVFQLHNGRSMTPGVTIRYATIYCDGDFEHRLSTDQLFFPKGSYLRAAARIPLTTH